MNMGVELSFWASVHEIKAEAGRQATFYLMDTGLNQNNWKVTESALTEAYPRLIGRPLGCIPGYRVNHVHEPIQVGRWAEVEKQGNHILATAEITDDVAWEKLSSGEWGPVSVVIKAFKVSCSLCGDDVTDGPDVHIVSGSGHEVIESFEFDRVDFVSKPAYPDAGLVKLGLPERIESDFIQKQGGNYRILSNREIPQKKRKQNMSELETLQEQVKDLSEKNRQTGTAASNCEGQWNP